MSDTPTEVQEPVVPENELEKVRSEALEWKDKYFRALAEIENSRKRLQRDKVESQSFAIQNVLVDLLQPIDHFEKALMHAENTTPEVKNWAIGFEMILQTMRQVLEDHGAQSFSSKGQQFDPHLHEAVETVPTSDVPEGTILEEFQKGYKMAGRIIRPAKVKVATAQVQE